MMKILIVEDDPAQAKYICRFIKSLGHETLNADDGKTAVRTLQRVRDIDVVITDYRLKEMNGMLLLNHIRKEGLPAETIMVTAYGNTEDAVMAVKMGAYDYLNKPLNLDELELTLNRIETSKELKETVEGFGNAAKASRLVYASPEFTSVMDRAVNAASADVTVLLTGESGTGKELVAEFIHRQSARASHPLVKVFCAAIPEGLMESELFGYIKGSFTGADKDRKGKIEYANRGTLFLDEISEIPMSIQSKLLRVIQEKEIQRVGEAMPRSLDLKIIAATNKDIKKAVERGEFREDLFYRLNVFPVNLPPLRERTGDVTMLARYFLETYNRKYDKSVALSDEDMKIINGYSWPGNVRELENLIINTVISGRAYMLKNIRDNTIIEDNGGSLYQVERRHIESTLRYNDGNVQKCAKILGIHRNTLIKKIKEMDIDLDFYRHKDRIK